MSRHSSITGPWISIGSGDCKPAVSIRKLECVQMQVAQRLAIIAVRSTQKPSPERAQMVPPRAQVLMVVIRNDPQVAQAELRNDTGNPVGHRKQGCREADILSGCAPRDGERIPHQFSFQPAREQSHRGSSWPALPRSIALRSLPPCLVSEVDVYEQKRTSTCAPACGRIQGEPKIPVHPHDLGQRARLAFADQFRRLGNESLIEFVNELEQGAAWPGRGYE